ncbi:DUF3014 domain-containing protein [Frateuria aurantia]
MASQYARRSKSTGPWLVILAVVVVIVGSLLIWRKLHPAAEADVASSSSVAVPAAASTLAPAVQHPVSQAPAAAGSSGQPLIPLEHPGPEEALSSLRALFTRSLLDSVLVDSDLVQRCVSTIDALPRQMVPLFSLPLRLPQGSFQVQQTPTGPVISPANARRYERYLRLLEQADPHAVVSWYLQHYTLFQQAYRDLGYPHAYFNDRLIAVIDHLLTAPNVNGQVALISVPPLYRYVNPQLQDLSAGQKLMIRLGPDDEARVKARLRLIRAQLAASAPPAG